MDLEAFRWLLTPAGQALLARAHEAYDELGGDPLRVSTLLRRDASPAQAAAALTQARLRERARAKFGDLAARMYFTPDGHASLGGGRARGGEQVVVAGVRAGAHIGARHDAE
jgi:hypothetical protein